MLQSAGCVNAARAPRISTQHLAWCGRTGWTRAVSTASTRAGNGWSGWDFLSTPDTRLKPGLMRIYSWGAARAQSASWPPGQPAWNSRFLALWK